MRAPPPGSRSPLVDGPSRARHAAFTRPPYRDPCEPAERSDRERRLRAHDRVPTHRLGARHRVRSSRPDVRTPRQLPRDVRPPVASRVEGQPLPGARRPRARGCRLGELSNRSADGGAARGARCTSTNLRRPFRRAPSSRPGPGAVRSRPMRTARVRAWWWWSSTPVVDGLARRALQVAASTMPLDGRPLAVWNCLTAAVVPGPKSPSAVTVVAQRREALLEHRRVGGVGRAFLRSSGAWLPAVVVVTCGTVVTVVVTVVSPPPDELVAPVGKPSPGSIASKTAHVMTASTMITSPRVFWNQCSTPRAYVLDVPGVGFPGATKFEARFAARFPSPSGRPRRARQRAVARVFDLGRDVARLVQRPVVLREVAHRDPGVDVVREVPSDVERHEERARPPRLADRVRGGTTVGRGVHAAVLGDRAESVDHPPDREVRQHPEHRVHPPHPADDRRREQHRLDHQDLPERVAHPRDRASGSRRTAAGRA